jgi:hypothetical protein
MTRTIAAQLHEMAQTVKAIADKAPSVSAIAAAAWALEDAANLAHNPRLRHLFDEQASARTVTPVTTDLLESEKTILAYVQANPGTTIDQTTSATGYSRNTTSVTMRTLMRRGQVRRQHGKPAKWWPKAGGG